MFLYFLFCWSGTPVCSQLVFCMHFCVWRCISDVSIERDVLHVHLFLHHLVLSPKSKVLIDKSTVIESSFLRYIFVVSSVLPRKDSFVRYNFKQFLLYVVFLFSEAQNKNLIYPSIHHMEITMETICTASNIFALICIELVQFLSCGI